MTQIFFGIYFLLLLVAGDCDHDRRKNQMPIPNPGQDRTLSIAQPIVRIPLKSELLKKIPEMVTVKITEVENPKNTPVSVRLYFESGDKDWGIAVFTLYPPDQPGTFVYRTNIVIQKMLAELKENKRDEIFFCLQLQNEKNIKDSSLIIKLSEPVFGNK
jgi:hypothetical protein